MWIWNNKVHRNQQEQILKNMEDITDLQESGGAVQSVNGKTGEVVLDATDIKLTTTGTTTQANIIRLDERIDDADTAIDGLDDRVGDAEYAILGLISNKQNKLTAGTNITIVDDVISASGGGATMFVAVYGTTPYSTVKQHIDAGDVVVVQYTDFSNTNYATYVKKNSSDKYWFVYVSGYQAIDQITLDSSTGWAKTSYLLVTRDNIATSITSSSTNNQPAGAKATWDLATGKEDTTNKTNTIDSSSTTTQYPNARAVHLLHTTNITHGVNVNNIGTPVNFFIVNEGDHIPTNGLVFVVDGSSANAHPEAVGAGPSNAMTEPVDGD